MFASIAKTDPTFFLQFFQHQCRECLYRALTEEALARHIAKNHSKPMSQKFKCELCDFVTTKKTDLSRHLQKSHRGSKVSPWIFNRLSVWPHWAIYWTLGNFLKPLATIYLPKSSTFLGNFWTGVKIYHCSSEIIFGQLLQTFGDFFWSHWILDSF